MTTSPRPLLAVPGASFQPSCEALWDPAVPDGHSERPGPCPLPQGPAFVRPAHNPPPSFTPYPCGSHLHPARLCPCSAHSSQVYQPPPYARPDLTQPPLAWPCPPASSLPQTLSFSHLWIHSQSPQPPPYLPLPAAGAIHWHRDLRPCTHPEPRFGSGRSGEGVWGAAKAYRLYQRRRQGCPRATWEGRVLERGEPKTLESKFAPHLVA